MKSKYDLKSVACIGCGVIGAGWVARLIENGIDVIVHDISDKTPSTLKKTLENAEIAYSNLTALPRLNRGKTLIVNSVAEAVKDAELIIESIPERAELKHLLYEEIEKACREDALIASSTSGILPSKLQKHMKKPGRFFVGHPFNPVYLLPLVEVVGGEKTFQSTITKAMEIYKSLSMHPIYIKKEIEAFVADRLLEAIWREALWLIKDGICTTAELDDIVRLGFGLRYAQMGVFETYRVAGGEKGMRHFLEQFGPCLKWPWTKLTDVPDFTKELVELISSQSDSQSGDLSISLLERKRDANIVAIQKALKANNWGVGQNLLNYEQKLKKLASANLNAEAQLFDGVKTLLRRVPSDWGDYNGHMNEARYLDCFCEATDEFMKIIGCDEKYVSAGNSYFTAETHIRHMRETKIGQVVTITTILIAGEGKKMHLFHNMRNEEQEICATGEHMLIHVSLETRTACPPTANVTKKLREMQSRHSKFPRPHGLGRSVGTTREAQQA